MSRRRTLTLGVLTMLAASLGVAACTAGEYAPTPLYTPSPSASQSSSSTSTASPAPSPSASPGTDIVSANCLQSYAPTDAMPTPGRMPSGTYMSAIQKRGYLIAGVSADTLLLGARNPVSNKIEGFDIDMLHAVSQAIFGDPNRIEYRVITALQREPLLQDNSLDIVARNMTINCARWKKIAFSTEYYRDGQKVLVRKDAKTTDGAAITSIKDLAGQKVCAPKGTSSMEKLLTFKDLQPVAADTHTGCLVLFQQGKVDAITGDETVLAGLASQDPYAVVVQGPAFTVEPLGLGVNKKHVDFVRFLNGVLEQMRADGRWTKSSNAWLTDSLRRAPTPPEPVYGRSP